MRLFAYVQVNESLICEVNNQALFSLIRDGGLDEDAIFDDGVMDREHAELKALMQKAALGDVVMVRALADLAATTTERMEVLGKFYKKGGVIVSVAEQSYKHVLPRSQRHPNNRGFLLGYGRTGPGQVPGGHPKYLIFV